MAEEMTIYVIVALVALLVLLSPFFLKNPASSAVGNLTPNQMIVTIYTANGESEEPQKISDFYEYLLTITSQLQINPAPTADIAVVPLIEFKGQYEKSEEFVISSGKQSFERQISLTIYSTYPRLSDTSERASVAFEENQNYVVSTSTGVFIVGMKDITKSVEFNGVIPTQKCFASFKAECEDAQSLHIIKSTNTLEACETGFTKECSETLNLCDGYVTITLRELDCSQDTAKADIEVEGGMEWDPSDQAILSLFRKSQCLDLERDVTRWKASCSKDFLASKRLPVSYR